MRKIVLAGIVFSLVFFAACGVSDIEDSSPDPQEQTQTESGPTVSGLGFDQGNYSDSENGTHINIQSTEWCDVEEDVIHCTFNLHDAEFGLNILYPEKIYQIFFGDGLWYKYDPQTSEIVDSWFDVDAELEKLTGEDAAYISTEIVSFIDDYFMQKFGYTPEEIIAMPYE
ncbi:MAG: hypothetical protein EOM23_04145 [Candidatus Moranbacteria bacterium]|nr:hypothetical protein [Candidatus Moranbacteria bacterium]